MNVAAPIPLFKVALDEERAAAGIAEVLRSRQLEHGPRVRDFERCIGERIGNPNVVAVESGTSALQLALDVAVRNGPHEGRTPADRFGTTAGEAGAREVLSTPLTFEGTNWPVLAQAMRLGWVDVDPATLTIDLDDLARKIGPATKAIMVVHWAGYPVDLDRLRAVLDDAEQRHGVRPVVIEDAAQAWGATYRGRRLGTHGNTCVYSFQSIKTLSCGGGGAVVFPTGDERERAVRRRWLGIDRDAADRVGGDYDVPEWGYRFTMTEINATIGTANLGIVDELIARNRSNAAVLDRELADVPGLELTERADDRAPSFWLYPVKVDDRRAFMARLAEAGIATSVMIRRNDAHSCVRAFRTDLPGMDEVADRMVHVPVGWWLTDDDLDRIVTAIRGGW